MVEAEVDLHLVVAAAVVEEGARREGPNRFLLVAAEAHREGPNRCLLEAAEARREDPNRCLLGVAEARREDPNRCPILLLLPNLHDSEAAEAPVEAVAIHRDLHDPIRQVLGFPILLLLKWKGETH